MSKSEKINEIISKNGFSGQIEFDGILEARVICAAYGIQASANQVKYATLGLYKDSELVVKVKLDDPARQRWGDGFGGYIYESPRIPNLAGITVDFEKGIFKGNRKELGFKDDYYTIAYDFEPAG